MTGALALSRSGPLGRGTRSVLAFAARPAGWAIAAVVLAVALVVGSVHAAPPTRAARIAALEDVLKCPSCVDLSIRQSDAAAAVNLRAEVVRLVGEGKTDAQIEAIAVAQYGTAELLVPPSSGLGALAWALPVAGLGGGGIALAAFLVRRRRRGAVDLAGPSDEDEALVRAALGQEPPGGPGAPRPDLARPGPARPGGEREAGR